MRPRGTDGLRGRDRLVAEPRPRECLAGPRRAMPGQRDRAQTINYDTYADRAAYR